MVEEKKELVDIAELDLPPLVFLFIFEALKSSNNIVNKYSEIHPFEEGKVF